MKHRLLIVFCLILALLPCALGEETPLPAATSFAPDLLTVDHRLYELGYRDSACTGEMTPELRNALKNFQTANGLELTASADEATVSLLMSGAAVSQRDYIAALAMEQGKIAVLANGSYGDDVLKLQKRLTELGYFSGECDGAYGRATEDAVCRFQLASGLQESGVVDRSMNIRLYAQDVTGWQDFLEESCASAGESGAHVRRIQIWLRHKNFFRGACTGRYGDGTQQAVKRFQTAMGLEASGDVDMETCIALFSDVSSMHRDMESIRRGESGADVEAMISSLASLGYNVGEQYNLQTELAVMQFQLVNEMDVSGVADGVTLARINHPNARRMDAAEIEMPPIAIDAEKSVQLARQAASQLGQKSGFGDAFSFVSYVYLKCGLPLLQQDQLSVDKLEDYHAAYAGQVLFVEADGREICGIATADGALIYADDTGYIVLRYLDMMDVASVFGNALEAPQ